MRTVIANDRKYECALRRVSELMDAEPGTPEGNELNALASAVEAYEAENFPIEPPSPAELRRFRAEQAAG